jgi:hypothetical protein
VTTTPAPVAILGDLTQFASLEALKAEKGAAPWSVRLVTNQTQQAFLIHQPPGHPNDTHYHLHERCCPQSSGISALICQRGAWSAR